VIAVLRVKGTNAAPNLSSVRLLTVLTGVPAVESRDGHGDVMRDGQFATLWLFREMSAI